jgi:glycosyltransferase involved in cell wall biosynthesis
MTQAPAAADVGGRDRAAPSAARCAVILLTFNSRDTIGDTVRAAKQVSPVVIAVDSHSTDGTPDFLRELGCEVHDRAFRHYADQRNWAIEQFGNTFEWQLHLDADEVLDNLAIAELRKAIAAPGPYAGYLLRRRTYFMGKPLRFGGATSWHMRLFKSGTGACEDRLYDQHFICSGEMRQLRGWLHDMNVGNLTEWVNRHNRWSNLEADELLRSSEGSTQQVEAKLSADPRQRRRYYKGLYYKAPLLLRPMLYFLFRYVVQLGFLDGRVGFLYAFLQALWFRMLVDAKLIEKQASHGR